MKKLLLLAVLLLTTYLARAQKVTIETDKKLNTDFSKYKTYTWASQVDSKLDPGFYFLNDLQLKERIRDAVAFSLAGRGYKMQRQMPDLIINFRVFDQAATLKGYDGYGTTYFGTNEVREPEDMKTYNIKAGSILINFIDAKTGQVVWQGVASGITNNNGFDRDHNKIKQAINLIFEKYPYRADSY